MYYIFKFEAIWISLPRIGLWSRLPLSDASSFMPSGCVAVAAHRSLWRSRCWRNRWKLSFPRQVGVVPNSLSPKPRVIGVCHESMSRCLHQRANHGRSNLGPFPDPSTQGAPRTWSSNPVVPATQGINSVVLRSVSSTIQQVYFWGVYFLQTLLQENLHMMASKQLWRMRLCRT